MSSVALGHYKYSYSVTSAPNIKNRDHVLMKSLDDLHQLCNDFNLPLMVMEKAQTQYMGIPVSDVSYSVYFTYKDGVCFAVFVYDRPGTAKYNTGA